MADPIESTPDAEVNREISEAAAAGARAARTRSPDDIANALKEGGEAVAAIAKSGWSWQKIALAIGAAVVTLFVGAGGVAMVVRDANPPTVVSTPVKADPDIAKIIADEFAKLDKSLTRGFDFLAKKIDANPAPAPIDPDKPKPPTPGPKKLTLPERVEVAVGSVAKIKASLSSGVQWVWRESPGLDVDKHGSTLYVQAERDGVYWVFAYTSVDGKIGDIAACMVVAGNGPQPPPGPTPEPKPTPKVDKLTLVIVWESSDTREHIKGVVGDYAFYKSLEPIGVTFFKLDKDQKDADGGLLIDSHNYRKHVDKHGLPTVMFFDSTGLVLKAMPLTTTAAIRATVTELTGR